MVYRDDWNEVEIGELGEIITGQTPKTSISENYGGNLIFLTPSDDMDKRYVTDTNRKLTQLGAKSVKNKIIPPNSICVSCIGSQLGKVVITTEQTVTNQQINTIIPNDKNDYMYLYYAMKIVGKRLNHLSKTSTAVPIINKTVFSSEKILLPPLKEQIAIAKLLSSLDDKIENNKAIIANLEAQAQAIFKSWFIGFEPFQDGDFVESELGMIPEGWEVKKIEEVTESLLGGTPARKKEEFWCGDIPWINSGELNKIRIIEPTEYITKKGLENSSTKLLPKKTTVIAITGATLGQVSLLEIDTCANQSVIGILENENLPYEYIYPFFLNNIDMIILNQTGSSQQHINNNDIKNTKMILPINKVMDAYEQIVSPIYKLVENYMFQNKVLSQTRDTLLPKLMSGEIRLGQDDIEEIENLL